MKEILIVCGIIIVAFILVLVFNAIKSKIKAPKLSQRPQHKTEKEQEEYALKLAEMIKCKTVSVDGSFDDTEFKKLRKVMEELFPLIHKNTEKTIFSDDCWVYKLKGKDESRNIMIMSHHDVVEAKGEWLHPGFCGEIFDGNLWGRGTIDTKTPLFAEFSALEE
ncbi:MAG: M20/M25/M40 family metallo-hydrolase, partial [Clostridia bacterium]|nr:M20/M25/M40 family metallo-hydrolase [Clostridia bacterium]